MKARKTTLVAAALAFVAAAPLASAADASTERTTMPDVCSNRDVNCVLPDGPPPPRPNAGSLGNTTPSLGNTTPSLPSQVPSTTTGGTASGTTSSTTGTPSGAAGVRSGGTSGSAGGSASGGGAR